MTTPWKEMISKLSSRSQFAFVVILYQALIHNNAALQKRRYSNIRRVISPQKQYHTLKFHCLFFSPPRRNQLLEAVHATTTSSKLDSKETSLGPPAALSPSRNQTLKPHFHHRVEILKPETTPPLLQFKNSISRGQY